MTTTTMDTAFVGETEQRPWWLTLIAGILAVIVGGILLWSPAKTRVETYMILIAVLGMWWLVQGIFDIIALFIDHSMWGAKLLAGAISILAGSSILMYPVATAIALPKIFVLVMGLWGMMYGVILLIMAFKGGGWAAGILGALGIIFGVALMFNYMAPGMGLTLLWIASVFALIGGIAMIFQAFVQKNA